jgi:hypothetical protein
MEGVEAKKQLLLAQKRWKLERFPRRKSGRVQHCRQ